MGFRRAKSTQGNTNCQKNIFEDDQVPDHHPRALKAEAAILSRNKPSIKPKAAGQGFYARFMLR